jgi:hypothetical protein
MPKFTKPRRAELLDHIRNGMRPGAAAELLGFTRADIFRLMDDDEELAQAVKEAEREATEHVEEALYQAAVSGNVTAARIWLERSKPKPSAMVPADTEEPGFDQELAELNKLAAGRD